ncbi:glycerophosphodiester phosphodiesterase [Desulfogranum mediterraneum]|uniref:glycerophosphodiester phosphodiesterase n=1 Tax=Desulfogranum mediterraneum TaxID=160661 RepID=UPI00040DBDE8|nr:glycerophosphodiester phosphodiesterase family protein [Desulfogranum mediterraneum]
MKRKPAAWPDHFSRPRLIAAHRGFRACFPENTQLAFSAACGRCDFLETDIRLSRELIPVVIHDPTLKRTSDISARQQDPTLPCPGSALVAECSLAELRLLDMGSWFLQSDPFATIASGQADRAKLSAAMPQRIMTLRELLNWARSQALPLNLELKELEQPEQDRLVVERVVREIQAQDAQPWVLISSFKHSYLSRCRLLDPTLTTAALVAEHHPPDLLNYLKALEVSAYHPEAAIIDRELIALLRRQGLAVNVYTVNEATRQQALFAAGANAIFTDFL